ncbi:diguanylate cyclase [Candidatus Fermentibacteria bacterium]|nr:diguanylate cyclase [Candidatus Fermentibacteria bacterium]
MTLAQSPSRSSAGVETQRRLLTFFAAGSLLPVLLLVYVSVVYLVPVARQGATSVEPAAIVMLIVASVILAVSGSILMTATSRRLGAIASSLADAVPAVPGVKADELDQAESAARRLKGVVEHQKAEIHNLRQEQAQLRLELRQLRDEMQRSIDDQPVPGTWDIDGWQGYLDQEVERARRYHRHFCVLFVQIHRFAETVAHLPSGEREEISRSITERLRSWIRLSDLMAGSPQQYYVMLLPETEITGGRKVAERLVARLCDGSFVTRSALEGISFESSGGIACYPSDARDAGSLVECARAALSAACAEGNGAVAIYNKDERKSGNWPPQVSP